jgi:hypothetical protein
MNIHIWHLRRSILSCWKLLLRYSPSSIKDRQLRENRTIAIDTGTEIDSKMTSVEERGNLLR